jgi:hypothetical protein
MANPEHVEILKQGVEVWNRWREENSNIKPDLSGLAMENTDIADAYLHYADLSSARLAGANMSWAILKGANLILAKLSGANLSRATLYEANLRGADLKNANLKKANINRAKLVNADLKEANLFMAQVSETDLTGADFSRANLDGAHLDGSNLFETNLMGTDLSNVLLAKTTIGNVDLNNAIGLEFVEHIGPSSIGIDTIYKSGGQIPEIFLRGCGVPENLIRHMKSLTMNPFDFYSCFISYSHQDKSFARRLHDQLQARGIRCWLDEHQMLPGDDIYEQVDRGIRMWDKVLLCCSEHSLTSWWVDNEVATAFNKEQQLMKDRKKKVLSLIPLNIDGFMFSDEWASGKRQQLKERLAANFTGWETDNAKFEEQFERVVKALQTEGAREEAPLSKL